ncbi:MAG: hypothetical protein D6800_14255, partial [Candidatus Zixiibacteriota bacterium]
GTPEYRSAVCLLAAADLYVAKHRFTVPAMFMGPETKEETERYRPLFDEKIRAYAEQALRHSDRFEADIRALLDRLENDRQVVEGKHALTLGDFRKAERCFADVLAKEPKRPDALRGMGEAAFGLGRVNEAQQFSRKALAIDGNDPETLNNLGVIAYARGELKTALGYFTSAVRDHPGETDAHLNILKTCADLSRRELLEADVAAQLVLSAKQVAAQTPDTEYTALFDLNRSLRKNVLDEWRDRYHSENVSVVLHQPPNGALKYLMASWAEVLTFMGVPTCLLPWGQSLARLNMQSERTVFITVADPAWQAQIDWGEVTRRHRDGRLEVGLITTLEHQIAPVDFYITFHLHPEIDPRYQSLDRPLLSLPFAINPLRHYMRGGRRVWDYFFVGTNSHLKQAETEAYLRPLVERYHGILAGARWTTGIGELSLADVPY